MTPADLRPALLAEDDELFASFLTAWLLLALMVSVWARSLPTPPVDLAAAARPAVRLASPPVIVMPPDETPATAPSTPAPPARRAAPPAPDRPVAAVWVGTTGETDVDKVVEDVLGQRGLGDVDAVLRDATRAGGEGAAADGFRGAAGGAAGPSELEGIGSVTGGRAALPAVAAVVPRLTASAPVVAGHGCDVGELRAQARARSGSLRWCYEQRLQQVTDLAGRVEVQWTIGPDGRVSDALLLDDGIGDDALASCLVAQMRRWTFSGGAGCTASSVLVFTKAGG